ncbi:MAG: shikimate dehydrogenase [Caldilineaceae bacterium]|nr:shikimate dehydrogenase [Caldilineaceae bacterium]MDE0340140.1 shikimate dehydrogenase [Caldilineaceae bacterium]
MKHSPMQLSSIPKPAGPVFYFIGVTTGQSSSRRVFPLWMEALGRPEVSLVGIDVEIHAAPARYRQIVAEIKRDPLALGALVTTHKIDLLAAAADLFDGLGPYARATQEVSSIAKDAGKLIGRATDPVAGGLSMDAILGEGYFGRTGGGLLMLGAGGSAVALILHLMQKTAAADPPRRIVVVNRSAPRLARLKEMVERIRDDGGRDIRFEFIQNSDAARNDVILAGMPPGSVVVNATGMGKDTPGSPLTGGALFPQNGVVWELNYRGELDFMRQAEAQTHARRLTVADGWDYFVHGWSQVISHVLHEEIDEAMFARLSELAASAR